jgi:hypothetical protein
VSDHREQYRSERVLQSPRLRKQISRRSSAYLTAPPLIRRFTAKLFGFNRLNDVFTDPNTISAGSCRLSNVDLTTISKQVEQTADRRILCLTSMLLVIELGNSYFRSSRLKAEVDSRGDPAPWRE